LSTSVRFANALTMTRPPVQIVPLEEAIRNLVSDGDTVALEGFTHLIPFAAGHEIIRSGRRDLVLVRMNRYAAGASSLPFAVLRGYVGSDLVALTPSIKEVTCPFTGEVLSAVSALELDVAVIHAQRADTDGNVQMWGIVGVQKEAALCARRVLVTVEEIVDVLVPRPGAVVLPHWTIDCVSVARNGAHPSYTDGYTQRDNDFYVAWDSISRDRETFRRWMDEHVLSG
jgi:glutaconate CoA-transferase subunit A